MTGRAAKQPMVRTDPARRGGIDLNAIAHVEQWLNTATLTQLLNEHSALNRWLDLPGAELWADQHAEKSARLKAIWQTIGRRFPEYAMKRGFRRAA